MKKLLFFIMSALFVSSSLFSFAQNTTIGRQNQRIQTQKQDRIHQYSYFVFEKGKLYQIDEGKRTEIKQSIRLGSGLMVNPDGTYKYGNMQKTQLKEGECLDMHAHRYSNQEMARKHLKEGQLNHGKQHQGRADKSKGKKY